MQTWEYMSSMMKVSDSPDSQLNQLGVMGWELVSVTASIFSPMANGAPKPRQRVVDA